MGKVSKQTALPRKQAGELLPLEAIDPTGLAVTSDGAFVRLLNVTPPNPLMLSAHERQQIAEGYCAVISKLQAGQALQFYVQSRPVNLSDVLGEARSEVKSAAGDPPGSADRGEIDGLSLSRWRLYAGMEESLRLHADELAAAETSFYIICPYLPASKSRWDLLRGLLPFAGNTTAPLRRALRAHRRVSRQSLALTERVRAELDAMSIRSRHVNGDELVGLLWRRFNPTQSDGALLSPPRSTEILGELDAPVDLANAREAARKLRAAIAQSPIDFERSSHHVEIDRDVEQTMWVATTADHTQLSWLLGATLTREPFTLSVHIKALDRRKERTKLKLRYRRVYTVNRGAEARGRVPDFDRLAQEQESAKLLQEFAHSDRVGLYETSIYHSIRARGPKPDLAALSEAVDYCAETLTSTADVAVNRGAHHQHHLWPSTLPLGRDSAGYSRTYATRNAADCVPLAGTSCGSPRGIPLLYSSPGKTLERIDPLDPEHENQTLLAAGKSGSGKTMLILTLSASLIARGAGPMFVIDRSEPPGHFSTLAALVVGSQHLSIGAEDSPWAVNHWDTPNQAAPSKEKIAFLLAMHAAMMGSEGLTVLERAHLAAGIREVYAQAHEQGVPARESMLRAALLERARQEAGDGALEIAAGLRSLGERLGEFCGDGAYSYLLDRETNIPTGSPLVVFNTEKCPEAILGPVMLAIVEYVIRQIRNHYEAHRHLVNVSGVSRYARLCTLVVDEAWHKVASPEAGRYLADLARRGRHLGLFLIVLSQALSDLNSQSGMPLLVNRSMVMLLKQEDEKELEFIGSALGLTPEQAALVGKLSTVEGRYSEVFLVNKPYGVGRLRFPVGPTEYWAFTNEKNYDIPRREEMIAKHNGDVPAAIRELAKGGVPVHN